MPIFSIDVHAAHDPLTRAVPLRHDRFTQIHPKLLRKYVEVDNDVSQLVGEHRLGLLGREVSTLHLLAKVGVFTKPSGNGSSTP